MSTPENTPEPGRDPNYPNNPPYPGGPPAPGGAGAPGGGVGPDTRPEPQYGQYASSPYGYGQASGQPPGAGQPSGYGYPAPPVVPAKASPPREVLTGSWLIIAAGVLSLIYNIITSFALPSLLTPQDKQAFSDAGLDDGNVTTFLVSFGIVIALIGFGIYLLIALFVRRGKNWARILGTVFAAFALVGIFTMLGSYFTSPLALISLVSSLLGIAGIVMLYLKPSAPYFRRAPRYPY